MKKKTFIVQLLNSKKPSRTSFTQVEDANFYSNDTDASLVFIPHEDTFDFQTAKVVMYNRSDESLVERDAVVTTEDGRKVASYEMPDEIISHWGEWTAQPVFISGGEIYSGSIVPFSVFRYLMHERPPRLNEVVTITKFIQQSQALVNDMVQNETQRVTQEQTRQSAETVRVQAENERSEKYGSYAQQFNDVITELSEEKDYHSLPEIAGARGGHDTLGQRLDETTAQLAQKADKSAIGAPTQEQVDNWLNANPDATTTVGDETITERKIVDGAVTAPKIAGAEVVKMKTVNLFNKDTVELDGYYERTTGNWIDNIEQVSSDFIPVEEGKSYIQNISSQITRYDENFNYISGSSGSLIGIPMFSGIRYVKISVHKSTLDNRMFVEGTTLPSEYVPHLINKYRLMSDWDVLSSGDLEHLELPNFEENSISSKQIIGTFDKEYRQANMFNVNDVEDGVYYAGLTGVRTPSANHVSSNFIPVKKGMNYRLSHSSQIANYDKDFNFITGGSGLQTGVPINSNISYMKVSVRKTEMNEYMVVEGNTLPTEYVPYATSKAVFDKSDWDVLSSEDYNDLESEIKFTDTKFSQKLHRRISEPIRLDLKDFSGYNQPFHPSVLYIAEGLGGYKYWLAQTPFPVNATPYVDRWEVPIIYKSHDGIEWVTVADPLDDLTQPEIDNEDYMSDPHLVYRDDTKTLEVWYRLTTRDTSTTPVSLPTKIIRKTTQDGVNWTAREDLIPYKVPNEPLFVRSHSVIWDDNKYKMWFGNNSSMAASKIYYAESSDGKTWNTPVGITLDIFYDAWHLDVSYINGKYHLLSYVYHVGGEHVDLLLHYISDNGIDFKYQRTLMKNTDGNSLYSTGLYRSISMKDGDNKIRVYFSGTNSENKREVGVMIADGFDKFNSTKKIDSSLISTDDGRTVEDLAREIDRLKKMLNS